MPRFSIQNALPVAFFLGIGCMCIYFGVMQALRSHERQSWPQVDAVVLESEAIFTSGEDSKAEIKMLVEYKALQNTYQALIYAQDVSKADTLPPRYAVGKTVTIHYDPTDPSSPSYHFPSVMSSLTVALIGLVPILPASLFVVFWIAMGFTHWKMSQARRHLSRAVQEAELFNQSLEQLKAEGLTVPPELLAKKSYLVQQVEEIHNLLVSLQSGIDDLTPPLEEDNSGGDNESNPLAQVVIQPEIEPPPETFLQRAAAIIILSGIPLLLGFVMTWWAPYYLITCQRGEDNSSVDCTLQQMLFGFIDFGEPEIISDLREIDYKMKGKIRKQRSLMRLAGTSTKKIYAGRAAFTTKSIKRFLTDPDSHRLQVSDGHTMLGMYFPYLLAMFSLAALIVTNNARLPNASVPFAIGTSIAGGIALLPFFYLCDIHNTSLTTWLLLASVIIIGGITNVIRQSNSSK